MKRHNMCKFNPAAPPIRLFGPNNDGRNDNIKIFRIIENVRVNKRNRPRGPAMDEGHAIPDRNDISSGQSGKLPTTTDSDWGLIIRGN